MTEDGVNDAMLRENLKDVVRHAKNGIFLSFRIDPAYAHAIIWASERIAELESQTQSPERSNDEVPADNDPHGECRSEIHQLQNLLGQVYDQCGNHRAAERRHCLSPSLRDEIQGYLQAAGHQCAITEQENKGGDMAETTDDDENRGVFFGMGSGIEISAITYCAAVAWGQNRIRHLERDKRDAQELLDRISGLRRENEELELELENEKAAYKRLEEENEQLELELKNLNKTILTLSKSPQLVSPDSDEEIHQQRRRERMLDEITLLCVKFDIKHKNDDSTWCEWGNWSRMDALDILRGIESVKNKQ